MGEELRLSEIQGHGYQVAGLVFKPESVTTKPVFSATG